MLRVTHHHHPLPLAGLDGISIGGIDMSSVANAVVNAIMPAVTAQMPNLVAAAWPAVQERLPGLVDQAWGQVQQQIPGAIAGAVPQITAQIPKMITSALPTLYAQAPAISAKLMPIVKTQLDVMVDSYARQYLGPLAAFKTWYPAVAMFASAISLFSAGIIIYRFWNDE